MFFRRLFLLSALLFFFCLKTFADTFIVTSNADAGPGTLREALTLAAANGTAIKDFINFNLPDVSEAGRTITLVSQLPDVTSNLVIDGSTQTGNKFGVSDAKVALFQTADYHQEVSGLFIHNQIDVTVLGLYIKYLTNYSRTQTNHFWQGINIQNSKNIQIGIAGKGNLIVGFLFAIATNFDDHAQSCENLSVQDNICDVDIDGTSVSPNINLDQGICFYNLAGQINIGGSETEGNLFANGVSINQDNSDETSPAAYFSVRNNKIGVNYLSNRVIPTNKGLSIGTASPNGKNTIDIEDNELANAEGFAPLFAINCGGKLTILRNYIGTDKTRTHNLNVPNWGIYIFYYQGEVQIGSTDPKDANVIGYCKPLNLTETRKVSFNKNSFFCARDFYPIYTDSYYNPLPEISITNITSNSIGGTATPNSAVELFYADDCGACSPKTYFASTTTDNNGKWLYTGTLTGSVLATASLNGSTSEYTHPSLTANVDDSQINLHPPDCSGSNGSITNIKVTSFIQPNDTYNYTWTDSHHKVVGHELDLIGIPEGSYTLKITGPGCGTLTTPSIPLKSKTITLDASNVQKSNAGCNGPTGSITGLTALNATHYRWMNTANNQIAGNSADLTGASPGKYQLTASNDFGCSAVSDEYIINATQLTAYPVYPSTTQPSCYAQNNGSITVSTNALAKSYRWVDASGGPAGGNSPQITGLAPGSYTLYLTDANGCETQYNSYPITELAELKATNIGQQTDDECGLKTGSISNVTIAGGSPPYTFAWYDADDKTLTMGQSISNLAAGSYTLKVTDSRCGTLPIPYTIRAITEDVAAPVIPDVQICSPGQAMIFVNSPVNGSVYRLYDEFDSTSPIAEAANGNFKISAQKNNSYFVSQLTGTCESERTEVKVSVGISSVDIANTITPNGDGINDYWRINGIENYQNPVVQIFNRYGQKVFESKGYGTPFDGKMNGKLLRPGVYYYIINLNKNCSLLSGNLTIIQ